MSPSNQVLKRKRSSSGSGDVASKTKRPRDYNVAVPIHRLPLDILLSIFLLARDSAGTRQSSYTALAISWVSSRWRGLALSTPLMWNFLDVPDEDIIDNFLPRCADTKLLVDMLLLDLDPNDDASTEILEELGRTKSLHITGFSDGGECTDLSLLDHCVGNMIRCAYSDAIQHVDSVGVTVF